MRISNRAWLIPALVAAALVTSGCSAAVEPLAPEAAAAATPTVARPTGVDIPSIGVRVDRLVDLGLDDDGRMEVPQDAISTGWFVPGPAPGEVGPAIMASHVSWNGVPGSFARLHELAPGAEIIVHRKDGTDAVFVVDKVETFPKEAFPTDVVYGNVTRPELRLITCSGRLDPVAHSYDSNIIAFAHLR